MRDSSKKSMEGIVLSNKMQKSVVVIVSRMIRHPIYQKLVEKRKKYYAHSEEKIPEGAVVRIIQTRPLSKLKRWRVVDIIAQPKEG